MSNPDDSIHLVMSACGGYGHVRPLRSLARDLARRGYAVTFIGCSPFRKSFEAIKGVEFVSFLGDADLKDDYVANHMEARNQFPENERFVYDVEAFFLKPLPDQYRTLQAVFNDPKLRNKRVLLLHDPLIAGQLPMLLGAPEARRVPSIAIAMFPLTATSKDTTPFGLGLPPQGEKKNRELFEMMHDKMRPLQTLTEQLLEPYRCRRSLPSTYIFDNFTLCPDLYLQCGVSEMEYPRSDLPSHVRFIGVFDGENDHKGTPEWFQSFVIEDKTTHPLILVTQGSLIDARAQDLIIPTIEACADLPVRLVVCAVHAKLPNDYTLPSNARLAEWIAFEDILQFTSIVVSNAGFGGICQAFSAGVPMILAGVDQDKADTSMRAEMIGAAVNLKTSQPATQQVREAIQTILGQHSYKEHALKLRKALRDAKPVESVIDAVNELVEKFY